MINPLKWSFAFFDLGSKETARRVRLHRNLRKVGAAIHSQSVYCMPYSDNSFNQLKDLDRGMFVVTAEVDESQLDELVSAYDVFISGLLKEVYRKMEALEDAKASSTDMVSRRGYRKRLNSMYVRLEHLEEVATLRQHPETLSKVGEFIRRVIELDGYEPGKLI
jgi:hypothetical protein